MLQTRVTQLLGIQRPIIQGGLAHLAFAQLCAAVSRAGGLGQLTATTMPDAATLRSQIETVRAQTDRPFGVNFALGRRALETLAEVAVAEEVPLISVTGGNPAPFFALLDRLGYHGHRLVLVSSVRQAQNAERLGADLVVAVGQEGGGHIGKNGVGTLVLVPRVVEAVSIPVLASGGIADGRGLAAALVLGAEGVEMGTRFVATQECPAHLAYKQALLQQDEESTTLVEATLGTPGRVLDGPIPRTIRELEANGADAAALYPFVRGETNITAAIEGNLEGGFVWAGQATGLIHDIPTVAALLERMEDEAHLAMQRLAQCLGEEG